MSHPPSVAGPNRGQKANIATVAPLDIVVEVCAMVLKVPTTLMVHVGAIMIPHDGICVFSVYFFQNLRNYIQKTPPILKEC